jgi:hypothetical protein
MSIKQLGGIFGRNPTFNDVTIEGQTNTEEITAQNEIKVSKLSRAKVIIESTGNGLSINNPLGSVEFYGSDVSAPGPGTKASIEASTEASLGDDACLIFRTSDGVTNNIETARFRAGTGIVFPSGYGLEFNGGPIWRVGSGTPEGAITADVGSLYTRTDGGASTTLYVKESGTGNTGWVAK